MNAKVAVLLAALWGVTSLLAQTPPLADTLIIDLDHDGRPDRLITRPDGSRLILKNMGDGRYVDILLDPAGRLPGKVQAPAYPDSQYFVDETAQRLPASSQLSSGSAVGDVDGDGDLDILVANIPFGAGWSGLDRLLINDGTGYFTDETEARLPLENLETLGMALGDLDNDGDLDIVLAILGYGGDELPDKIYINDGNGYFTDETVSRLPARNERSKGITIADINSDGSLDILIAKGLDSNRVYLNDGSGHFSDATAELFLPGSDTLNTYILLPVNADGDFDLDLVLINAWNQYTYGQADMLWLNNGSGYFTLAEDTFPNDPDDASMSGDARDLDGDGLEDILVARAFRNGIYMSTDSGTYTDETDSRLPANDSAMDILLGDVNGDGLFDIYSANSISNDQLFLNEGTNIFGDTTSAFLPPISSSSSRSLELADFDGDGDLDVFLATTGDGQNRLLINHGNVADAIPPTLNFDPEQFSGASGLLRLFAQDNMLHLDTVRTWVRIVGADVFSLLQMTPAGGNLFQTDLSLFNGSTIEFYFEALDLQHNRATLPLGAPDYLYTLSLEVVGLPPMVPSTKPERPFISNAYPNPFNPSTKFDIYIPSSWGITHTTITVYGIGGRKIQTIISGYMEIGNHSINWSGADLASGVYILRIIFANSFDETNTMSRKIILLK